LPDAKSLRSQAARCRRLAQATSDEKVAATLEGMAEEYLAEARRLDASAAGPAPEPPAEDRS